ncbi:kinase-like protein [Auriscalpium vulgare]|uniref:Kinase-like protein n=1 Tax=Auriscalpium vulgare TaxID=40419 RepID=A0ACB8RXJ6_9AGAM|nr:kinase-like protein [Auriscalpium vulgare]
MSLSSYLTAPAAALQGVAVRAKLGLYLLFTLPPRQAEPNTFFFRFGIPIVLKRTQRLHSTEADALRFLNRAAPHLPIPRLLDSFVAGSDTYTVMTRLPGRPLIDISDDELDVEPLAADVLAVLYQLWRIPQPAEFAQRKAAVMASASGHGLPHPALRIYGNFEDLGGPYPSIEACYETICLEYMKASHERPDLVKALEDDPIVWVHGDLRMQNILVGEDGRLSGIVDWEDSGWLPRQWQLHMLRHPGRTCFGAWVRYWLFDFRFDEEVERGYSAIMNKDMGSVYPFC